MLNLFVNAAEKALERGPRGVYERLFKPEELQAGLEATSLYRVRELAAAGADGFGVGENITCSPDAATGVGAVGKLVLNGHGKLTMKLARGSGKATLPGLLQCYRFGDHDLLTLSNEPPPPGGTPLLEPVWRGRHPVAPPPAPAAIRERVRAQLDALPSQTSRAVRELQPDVREDDGGARRAEAQPDHAGAQERPGERSADEPDVQGGEGQAPVLPRERLRGARVG